jgi:hypothetical protein
MQSETWESESAVAKKLCVAREVLVQFRKTNLEKNRDWKVEHKQVELSPDAIDRISTALGATADPGEPDTHNTPPAAVPEVPVELEILRIYPNPRLLAAKTDAGVLVLVRVPRNKNFRPRMKIKAKPPTDGAVGSATLYTLEGRCPRYPGRW